MSAFCFYFRVPNRSEGKAFRGVGLFVHQSRVFSGCSLPRTKGAVLLKAGGAWCSRTAWDMLQRGCEVTTNVRSAPWPISDLTEDAVGSPAASSVPACSKVTERVFEGGISRFLSLLHLLPQEQNKSHRHLGSYWLISLLRFITVSVVGVLAPFLLPVGSTPAAVVPTAKG